MKNLKHPVFLILTGIIVGIICYYSILGLAYNSMEKHMLKSNFLVQTFEKDPSLSGALQSEERLSAMKGGDTPVLTWRILNAANVIDNDLQISDVSNLLSTFFQKEITNTNDIRTTTSLDLLIDLLQSIGKSQNGLAPEARNEIKKHIVQSLSEKKGALDAYDEFLLQNTSQDPYKKIEDSSTDEIHAVLNRLFYHYRVEQVFVDVPNSIPNSNLEAQEEYKQIKDVCFQILLSISDDKAVKYATQRKEWIKGPEQLVMICLFFVALLILIVKRNISNKNEEHHEIASRYYNYYNWIFSSLTAIGFIGTIRGLSNALSDADIIFRSGAGLDQAISISSITQVLGVAFSTTLIALLLTLLLGLLKLFIDPTNKLNLD
ncbi:MotA/TolQ/ExbB proton channel family protein [Tenacibaculum tangerinum]|uniref:MotA/TolQ/ExbB proton channel family protein n=1 Tax=Tenacibaculum tangerinum TaxID=3038772 RepID=A0ABY8L2J3_9FLAO|nr:MotA/TolQ/ExbB proton channel family protein [Tenacibaculum tangerinum]WGH75486.1 MotA/TolQ/ExbB proton channel family protein [Tenacibaculum tangerinum]